MNQLKLLHLLENDPRMKVEDLADILNETVKDVEEEMTKLHDNKIICGYHTVINWDKTNEDACEAMIEVSAKPEKGFGYDKIAEKIARLPEVSDLYLMSGNAEYLVKVKGKTMREIAEFVGSRLAPLDGVSSTATYFMLKKYKVDGVAMEFHEEEDDRMIIS